MNPRAYHSGAAGTPDDYPAPVIGFPRNASGGAPATVPGPRWFFMVGEEARGLMVAGGIQPRTDDNTLMLQAIRAIGASPSLT